MTWWQQMGHWMLGGKWPEPVQMDWVDLWEQQNAE